MSAKEKADEVFLKMSKAISDFETPSVRIRAKMTAEVLCNEILTAIPFLSLPKEQYQGMEKYWQEVRTHIINTKVQ